MHHQFRLGISLLFLLAGTSPAAFAGNPPQIPARDFARYPQVMSPRLSPDGNYLAVRVDDASGYSHELVIYKLPKMTVTSILKLPKFTIPLDITWVSDKWLVIAKGKAYGSLGEPSYTGELISTDVSGKHQNYLWGSAGGGRRSKTRQDDGYASIQSLPNKLNGHFYMTVRPYRNEHHSILYDVNAEKNTRHLIADMDVHGMNFLVNPQGQPAFASGTNIDFNYVAYQHKGKFWSRLDSRRTGTRFFPYAYLPDNKTILADFSADGGPMELISEKVDGSERKVLASDDFASVGNVQWSAYPYQPFAASTKAGKPKTIYLRPKLREAAIYEKLRQTFAGKFVDFINFSRNGDKLLFYVSSDRDPGTYYLLDTRTFKASRLFSRMKWINPKQMAERKPIRFKASDGMELAGFLTLPPNRDEKNLPMVLLPHGGPYGERDEWFFDSDAQFLANRGYAVLQVNFRGSGGRGVNFQHAGYRKWGTRIQQDLIDGVKWAIDHHYADPKRICTYGGSFGGYAALMTVIRAPKLFQCAIGYAGVYDLPMLLDSGNISSRASGRSYLDTVLGHDKAELEANSPDKLADKITVPVFLIHGKDDEQAPFAGAEDMRDALEKAHKPYEWMAKGSERHGFYDVDNNIERLQKIQAFLKKHIGEGAPAKS
ncbi:MAG: prolyl oligopeptidase family serine peptidase [Rhodanobacteraceae bacterium]